MQKQYFIDINIISILIMLYLLTEMSFIRESRSHSTVKVHAQFFHSVLSTLR